MSGFTKRYLVICRADLAAAAETAVHKPDIDDDPNSLRWFDVGLSASGNPPAQAYWCSAAVTPAMATAIASRLKAAGATNAEVTPVPAGGQPNSNRFAIFDAAVWDDPDDVLTACGLQRVQTDTP